MKSITTHDGLTFPPPRRLNDVEEGAIELLFELARDQDARSVLFAMRNPTIRQTMLDVLAQAKGLGLSAGEEVIGFLYLGTAQNPPRTAGKEDITAFVSAWTCL